MEALLARHIYALGVRRGLSPAEMARAIGVSVHQVQGYESGEGRLEAACLWKLSQVLEVSIDDLMAATACSHSVTRH